jgi:aryl-alcohol dehydrogenase-like predicted oxidoreductase
VNKGGNFIDTADVYGMGISEHVIGRFIKTVDKEIFVGTKLGRRHDKKNGWPQNFTYARLDSRCSLILLKLPFERTLVVCPTHSHSLYYLIPKLLISP